MTKSNKNKAHLNILIVPVYEDKLPSYLNDLFWTGSFTRWNFFIFVKRYMNTYIAWENNQSRHFVQFKDWLFFHPIHCKWTENNKYKLVSKYINISIWCKTLLNISNIFIIFTQWTNNNIPPIEGFIVANLS